MLLSDGPVTPLPSRKSRFGLFPLFEALRFQKATFLTGWMPSRTPATFLNPPQEVEAVGTKQPREHESGSAFSRSGLWRVFLQFWSCFLISG